MNGVVVVLSGFPRRSETFALAELDALARAGVLLAAFATKPGDGLPPHADAARLASYVTWLSPGDAETQAREIIDALDGRQPSAVHGYFAHTPADVAERASQQLGVPFGFSVHARDARKVPADILRDRAARAAAVVTCNTDVHDSLTALGIAAELVPHGVNLARFTPTPLTVTVPLRLLAVGRLVAKKGFDVLLQALARVSTPWHLELVGDGPELSRLLQSADHLGIIDRITFNGAMTHEMLPRLYAEAHAVVVPSVVDQSGDRDGLPNVVLEAMASGRLVIGSRAGAIASAVHDDETGWLVPSGDAMALAERIERLAADPTRAAALAAAGRACVEREYEGRSCARRFVEILAARYA